MNKLRRFLLDSDAFIAAHRQHYRFSFCPAYWRILLAEHENKRVASVEPVRREILQGKDRLAEWIKSRTPKTFFKGIADRAVTREYAKLAAWVNGRGEYSPEAKAEFATSADGWLVAYAVANGYVVCTYEVSRPESKARVMLPDVANWSGVACGTPHDMLEELNVRMVLGRRMEV